MIRLAWWHFAIVASGLLTVLAVVWIALMSSWADFYAREFGLPRLEEKYGFDWGTVTLTRRGVVEELLGVVSVNPSGDLAKLGVRRHDIPFDYHGNGAAAMYSALVEGERGHLAEFEVVNADDWAAGDAQPPFRTVSVPPRNARK
jgi:hypothetical protein